MGYRLRNALIEEYGHIINCGHMSTYPRIDGNEWENFINTHTKPEIEKLKEAYRLLLNFFKKGYLTDKDSVLISKDMFSLNYAKYGLTEAKNKTLHWVNMNLGTEKRGDCRYEVIKQWTKMKMKKLLTRMR